MMFSGRSATCIIGVILQASIISGLFCNPQVSVETTQDGDITSCDCNDNSLVYDYRDNSCKSMEELYGAVDFCGHRAMQNATGCFCYEGWQEKDGNCVYQGRCKDSDLCTADDDTICYDTETLNEGYACICDENHFRKNGNCATLNALVNPRWNDCEQVVIALGSSGYKCECFSACFELNPDGKTCSVVDGCSSVEGPEGSVCVKTNDDKQENCYAAKGYKKLDNGTYVDSDECAENTAVCYDQSTCRNIPDGGGYACDCHPGYTDFHRSDSDEDRECVELSCSRGTNIDCIEDPCMEDDMYNSLVCQSTGPLSKEYTSSHQQMVPFMGESLLITGDVAVVGDPIHSSHLKDAVDAILGAGVSQVQRINDGNLFHLSIITTTERLNGSTAEDIKRLIVTGCQNATLPETACYMPYGIEVIRDFYLTTADFCESAPEDVCDEFHKCKSLPGGKYQCGCKQAGRGTYLNGIEDCRFNEWKDDADYYEDVTIGLSITLAFVVLGILGLVGYRFNVHKMVMK